MSTGYIRSVTSRNAGGGRKYLFNNVSKKPYWTQKADMITGRMNMISEVVDGLIYVIGGNYSPNTTLNRNDRYNPDTNTWGVEVSHPVARSHMSSGVIDGKIYVIGGAMMDVTDMNTCYNPETGTWSTKTKMPFASRGSASSVVGSNIYILGGLLTGSALTYLNSCYNSITDTWSTKADTPTISGEKPVSFTHNGKIYLIGPGASNNCYDPVTDTWSASTNAPTINTTHGTSCVIGDRAYLLCQGGCFYFDLTDKTWHTISDPPPVVTHQAAASTVNWKIYIFGGLVGSDIKTTRCYDPEAGIPSIEIHGENLINLDKKALLNNVEIQGKTTVDAGKKSILYLIEDNTTGTVEPIGDIVVG